MLTLSGSLRVFLALAPCDMRKSFDGLHAEVISRLGTDAKDGKLSLEPAALAMLTDGIDLRDGMRRAWFEREK